MKRKLRFPFYLIDPLRRKKNIADWMNPVFAKEMRSKAFGGGIWIFRGAYLCFGLSMLLMALVAGNLVGQTPDVIRTDLGVASAHFYPFGGFDRLFDWLDEARR